MKTLNEISQEKYGKNFNELNFSQKNIIRVLTRTENSKSMSFEKWKVCGGRTILNRRSKDASRKN